jgi:uncharacterized protein DUF4446
MHLSNSVLSILVLISLGLAAVVVGLELVRAGRERMARAAKGGLPADVRLEAMVEQQAKAIQKLEATVRQLMGGERKLAELTQGAIQHVGVVRFDAFEDMGGRLSFSTALLDGHGDGVVITSINGRQDTRCYAKQVRGGTSIHNLSDEEEEAIREALGAARQAVEAR